MINKIVSSVEAALAGIGDSASIMIGGFGAVGQPDILIDGLVDKGARDLTIITNNAGAGLIGLARLLQAGQVRRIICSYPRSAGSVAFEALFNAGRIELELVPQGTLAERIRAAGAGIGAFYTPTAFGTELAHGKETREIAGRQHVLEYALPADVALVEAWQADRWGNCTYKQSGRNFNPIMATAARLTVVQSQHLVALGTLNPETVMTPGIFVDRVVHQPYGDPQG